MAGIGLKIIDESGRVVPLVVTHVCEECQLPHFDWELNELGLCEKCTQLNIRMDN